MGSNPILSAIFSHNKLSILYGDDNCSRESDMPLYFFKENDNLILSYCRESFDLDWVIKSLNEEGSVVIRKCFTFKPEDALSLVFEWGTVEKEIAYQKRAISPDESLCKIKFLLGKKIGGYYKINKSVIGADYNVYFAKDIRLIEKYFIADRNIGILPKLVKLASGDVYIGGEHKGAISNRGFDALIENFPNTTELNKYARSRIYEHIKAYLKIPTDAQQEFESYLARKPLKQLNEEKNITEIYSYEYKKYDYIRKRIYEELEREVYNEKDWQNLILNFILLIYPKYIGFIENLKVKDNLAKNRFIDIALIDVDGNIDIIEIKKPFKDRILRSGLYRGNYTPHRQLSGAVMQAEKYLFHLMKLGSKGERELTERYAKKLPQGMSLKITNPKALIILGRSNNFDLQKKNDFELIKRKYAHVADILTYDDILRRLDNVIESFKKRQGSAA